MKTLQKHFVVTAGATVLVLGLFASHVQSHCEVPCGIYNDSMRIDMMAEDITTIEKCMNEIAALSAGEEKNYNQLVRWVMNKEDHADKLSDIVTQYFMKQRIKPAEKSDEKAYADYIQQLTLLHKLMVTSMKCKQTTDLQNVITLRETLDAFSRAYPGEERHTH